MVTQRARIGAPILGTARHDGTLTIGGPIRPRRLRQTAALRRLVRETRLDPANLVAPLFVLDGHGVRQAIPSLPGQARLSPDEAVREASELARRGVGGVLLFGTPAAKDPLGSGALDPDGAVPATLRAIRESGVPLVAAADTCLCAYTDHGHCGLLRGGRIDDEASVAMLADVAAMLGAAGADLVAPSAMMDGQVRAIRARLDETGQPHVGILAYASKHASALYGPFRDAAGSAPAFGDRRSYQLDPANGREGLRELELDLDEGADILMVKPAITSLDVLALARARFDVPLAAYQVSGELAMLEAAAAVGALDRRMAALEMLTAIRRAGADIIVTYLAGEAALWLSDGDVAW